MKNKTSIIITGALSTLIICVGIAIGFIYQKINSPACRISEDKFIYIDEPKNYSALLTQLKDSAYLKDVRLFTRLADRMKYPANIKSGKYRVTPKMSYLEIVRMLRNGNQEPVKLTYNNIRLKKDFTERIGKQLMFDGNDLFESLNDSKVTSDLGFDTLTVLTMFIPDTYEFYWNTNVENFLGRMLNEYNRFWTDERKNKAQKIGLTPVQVSILASIVEEETAKREEYPIVAGLYINRLNKNMLLQADPTVKFAVGDITLRRILNKHLQVDSPYNTYKNTGLPPGPIRLPSIASIDGVLNHQKHSYLYMCAKEDFSGAHNFATSLKEHNRNAQYYRAALNKAGIR